MVSYRVDIVQPEVGRMAVDLPSSPEPDNSDPGRTGNRRLRKAIRDILIGGGIAATLIGLLLPWLIQTGREAANGPLETSLAGGRDITPNYLFSRTVSPLDAPIAPVDISRLDTSRDDVSRFRTWARNNSGTPYSELDLELVIQGRDSKSVVIQGVDIRDVGRSPTVTGGWVNGWSECGATLPSRSIVATIRSDRVDQALYVDGSPRSAQQFRVSDTEVEIFDIEVLNNSEETVRFAVDIRYIRDGQPGKLTVESTTDGEPLILAGGGRPDIYSTAEDPARLMLDRAARESLSRSPYLC